MKDDNKTPAPTHLEVRNKAGESVRQIALEGLTVHRLARELQHGPKPFDTIVLVSVSAAD